MKATGDRTSMVMITTTPANSDPFSGTWLRLLVEAGFGTADTNPPAGLSFFKRTVNARLLYSYADCLPLDSEVS
jgi:hypothetical protein